MQKPIDSVGIRGYNTLIDTEQGGSIVKKFDSNIMMMEMCMFSMRMCMCMPFSDELPSNE